MTNDISSLPQPVDAAYVKIEPSTGSDANKVPVIILHGIFGNNTSWINIAKEIAEQTKRTFYCFDLRDHGESPWTEEFTFNAVISDLVNFMNVNKIEKANLIGHSLGGMIGSRLATLFPDLLEKLVIVDIHPKKKMSENENHNLIVMLAMFFKNFAEQARTQKMDLETAQTFFLKTVDEKMKGEKRIKSQKDNLTMRNGEVDWKFNINRLVEFLMGFKKDETTPNWQGPVLEVYGSESIFINKSDEDSIRELLPNIRFEVVQGGDHSFHTTHPKELIEKVVTFFDA